MATFEGGTAIPPSATEQISGTFMWPLFDATTAIAGASANAIPTKQLSSINSEYTRKKTR